MKQRGITYSMSRLVLLMQGRQWLGLVAATGVFAWSNEMREASKGGTETGPGRIGGTILR